MKLDSIELLICHSERICNSDTICNSDSICHSERSEESNSIESKNADLIESGIDSSLHFALQNSVQFDEKNNFALRSE